MIITKFAVTNNYSSETSTPFGVFKAHETKILSGNSEEVQKMELFFLGRTGFTFTELPIPVAVIPSVPVSDLVSGASVPIDLNVSQNFNLVLEEDATLEMPTNQTVGQNGYIFVSQDGTGGWELAYDAAFLFAGGSAPVITVGANAMDKLRYTVLAVDTILIEVVSQAIATV